VTDRRIRASSIVVLGIVFVLTAMLSLGGRSIASEHDACTFTGEWDSGVWGTMTLTQSGEGLTGSYTYQGGKISGSVENDTFTGTWSEDPSHSGPDDAGGVVLTLSGCNSFTGTWGYGKDSSGGDWEGSRIGAVATDEIGDPDTIVDLDEVEEEFRDPIAEKYGLPVGGPGWEPNPLSDYTEVPCCGIFAQHTLVHVRGNVFVFRSGTGKWMGPVGSNVGIFSGDWINIPNEGYAELTLGGSSRLGLSNRTQMRMPGTLIKRGILERGAIHFWENLKRLAKNEDFPVEGGHSISGHKGTEYILEVDPETGTDKVTVKDGSVMVWHNSDNSIQKEINAGESAEVSADDIGSAEYDWKALQDKYGFTDFDSLDDVETSDSEGETTPTTADGDEPTDDEEAQSGGIGLGTIILIALGVLAGGSILVYLKTRKR